MVLVFCLSKIATERATELQRKSDHIILIKIIIDNTVLTLLFCYVSKVELYNIEKDSLKILSMI